MPKESLFDTWTEQQGVTRPFEALCRMDDAARKQIAEMLDVDLSNAWEDGRRQARYDLNVGEDELENASELPFDLDVARAQAEACLIIGQDGKGIQARSQFSTPWGNNLTCCIQGNDHTWSGVLVSVIREFELPCRVERKSEEELESVIFDYFAEQDWEQKDAQEQQEIERFIDQQPDLIDKLKAAGLNTNKRRWIVNLMFQAAKRGGFHTYIHAAKVAAWMNRTLDTKIMMKTATKGMIAMPMPWVKFVLWALMYFFGPSREPLVPVIAFIHQHYLLEKLEGFSSQEETTTSSSGRLAGGVA